MSFSDGVDFGSSPASVDDVAARWSELTAR
jgi:hypothetical protein